MPDPRSAVVLIHGWCCHAGFWRGQIEELAPAGDVIAPGLADAAPTIEAFADTVAELVALLPHETVALVGHSMGGPVALEAAIRLGSRCRLVLGVDTFTDAAFYAARPPAEIEARVAGLAADFAGTIGSMVGRIVAPGTGSGLTRWIATEMSAADPASALPALRSLLAWDISERWPLRPCAVETINSAWLDAASQQVACLDGLVVHPMEGVGHFPMLEAPADFNARASSILRRHLPAAGAA